MLFFLLINVIWAGRGCYGQRGREGERRKGERKKEERKKEGRTGKKGKLLQIYLMPEFSELSLCSSIVTIYKMKIKYETHLKDNCQLSWQCVCLYMELALCEIYLGYWALLVFNLECPKSASTFFFWESFSKKSFSSSHPNYRLSLVN